MKKTLAILCVAVVVFFSVALPVSAVDGEHLQLKNTWIFDGNTEQWVGVSGTWTPLSDGGYQLRVLYKDSSLNYQGIRADFEPYSYTSIESGYYYAFEMQLTDNMIDSTVLPDPVPDDFKMEIITSAGDVIRLSPYVFTFNDGYWIANFAAYVGDGDAMIIDRIRFEANVPSAGYGTGAYTIECKTSISIEMTPEMKQHQELIGKIDSSTQSIIDNQNQNTTSILNELLEWFSSLFENDEKNTQAIVDAVESQTNEDFGYSDPAGKGDADADIADLADQISALSDDISKSVDDFKVSINGLKVHMQSGKKFIWGWLDYVPAWFTAIITGFAGLLIARKIVK